MVTWLTMTLRTQNVVAGSSVGLMECGLAYFSGAHILSRKAGECKICYGFLHAINICVRKIIESLCHIEGQYV